MDLVERARKYLSTMEPSISGSNGHNALFSAAVAVVQGFDFDEALSLRLLAEEFNPRCSPPWSERDLRHKVTQARTHAKDKPAGYLIGRNGGGRPSAASLPSPTPQAVKVKKRIDYDPNALQRMMVRGFTPTFSWLAERSPIDPRDVSPAQFLDTIFLPGEKTLIFWKFASQGQLGHVAGNPGQTYHVGDRPGLKPVKAEDFARTGREGAWFLPSPLDGKWYPSGQVDGQGNPILSRRTGQSVTCFRQFVLESDDASDEDWLNLLCQLPMPIAALYTSGGKSIHALVRIDTESKSQFDAFRDRISPLLSKLGADPGSMTAVRLTRLPGILREGTVDRDGRYQKFEKPRLQRLLYLNPTPLAEPLKLMPRLRVIPAE